MRRLARHIFTLCSAVSLLLCMAVCMLWVRSYWFSEKVVWRNEGGQRSVQSTKGHVVVDLLMADWSGSSAKSHGPEYERDEAYPPFNWLVFLSFDRGNTSRDWEWGGFAWHEMRRRDGVTYLIAVAPFWSLALATAALPLGWMALRLRSRVRERRHKRRGLCPSCGYDLRATPDRCPECGRQGISDGLVRSI